MKLVSLPGWGLHSGVPRDTRGAIAGTSKRRHDSAIWWIRECVSTNKVNNICARCGVNVVAGDIVIEGCGGGRVWGGTC